MKNLGMLYVYELKKLLKRKLAWVMVFVLMVFMTYSALPSRTSGGTTFSLTEQTGNTISRYISGAEQRKLSDEGERRISGQIMDENFFQNVRQASAGNGQYLVQEMWERECYFYLIDNSYYAPYCMVVYNMGLDPTQITAEGFYQYRQNGVELQWAGLTDREVSYWQSMEARVEKPFVYHYVGGYQDILSEIFGLSNVIPLVAAVCLCGVFSEEKRTRVGVLILSSKYGRFPQYLAKILAGITVVLAATVLVIGADAAVVLLMRGWDGFDAAVQLGNMNSSLPITMGQATLILLGLLLLYSLLCGGVTMLFSVFTQNTVAALSAPVLLMICQTWLRLDVQAAEYLPNQLFNPIPTLRNVNLVPFFGSYLNNLQFGFILYGGLAVVLIILCWCGWRRNATV